MNASLVAKRQDASAVNLSFITNAGITFAAAQREQVPLFSSSVARY